MSGWKLVPVEPTREMLNAYVSNNQRFHSARSDWAAMIAAAPEPDVEPVAWRWLYNGSPDGEKCFPMPGPDVDVVARVGASEFPRTVQYLYAAPQPAKQPLTDAQIDAITCAVRDALLDHLYEHGTVSEGAQGFIRKICRAIEAAHGVTGDKS